VLRADPQSLRLGEVIEDHVSRAFVVGTDAIEDAYEEAGGLPRDLG
jgi:hypothetical protein